MELIILERVMLLSILQGITSDIETLKSIKKAKDAVALSDKEIKESKYDNDGTKATWEEIDAKKIELGEIVEREVKAVLTKLSDEKKLTSNHIGLYEKLFK